MNPLTKLNSVFSPISTLRVVSSKKRLLSSDNEGNTHHGDFSVMHHLKGMPVFTLIIFCILNLVPRFGAAQSLYYNSPGAYELSSASTIATSTIDGDFSLEISPDGSRIWVHEGDQTGPIVEYDLTTPYDLTTAVPTGATINFGTNRNASIELSDNGNYAYLSHINGNQMNIHRFSLSTPFSIATAVQDETFSFNGDSGDPAGRWMLESGNIFLSKGGNKLLVAFRKDFNLPHQVELVEYDLPTPYSLTGITEVNNYFPTGLTSFVMGADFRSDGRGFIVKEFGTGLLHEYSMPTPFSLTGIVKTGSTYNVVGDNNSGGGVEFSKCGNYLYSLDYVLDNIRQVQLHSDIVGAACGGGFNEDTPDIGTIIPTESATINLVGKTFTNAGSVMPTANYTITNLPTGLTPVLTVAADGMSAVLTLSGAAVNNHDTDDVADLVFTWNDAAFVGGNASGVSGANGSSYIPVNFFGISGSACTAGTAAPTLSSTALSNTCPATAVDLTTITASNQPAGTSLTWHTATPATTANLVSMPTMAGMGTYHAAFYDSVNDCYSGSTFNGDATTSASVTITSCCNMVRLLAKP